MNIEAPTFNALNKPQKRALILRDHLRFVEPRHLDTFINGISNLEPPSYKKISGTIQPRLTFVTLTAEATRFDLGNVLFPEENNTVYRTYLTIEDGRIEMRTEEALPMDDANLESVAIHGFIAKTMVPMYKDKFQAIFARMNSINDARRAAHKMAQQAPAPFYAGQTLARLDPKRAKDIEDSSQLRQFKKRQPGEPVTKHVSNTHKWIGLDVIPDKVKRATFNTIPGSVKVEIFNNVVKTAFPNFDNLMVASWNVVSIYSACGSDFPELHRAIIDLKGVLQDFEESFMARVDSVMPKYRHDFASSSGSVLKTDPSPSPPPDLVQRGSHVANHTGSRGTDEFEWKQYGNDAAVDGSADHLDETQHDMPPPRTLQITRQHDDQDMLVGEEDEDVQHDILNARRSVSSHSEARGQYTDSTGSRPLPTSSHEQLLPPRRNHLKRPRSHLAQVKPKDHDTIAEQANSPDTTQRHEHPASSISTTDHPNTPDVAQTPQSEPINAQHPPPSTPPPPKKQKPTTAHTTQDLRQEYHDRKAALLRTFGSLHTIPAQSQQQLQQLERAMRAGEQDAKDGSAARCAAAAGASWLGQSILGAKKGGGRAPVAPMVHMRRDGGGGGEGARRAG